MSIRSIIRTAKTLRPKGKLTRREAKRIADSIPSEDLVTNQFINESAAEPLRLAFPEFPWRVALDRTGERTRVFVTVMKDDPREHYTGDDEPEDQTSIYCIHCGKNHTRGVPPKGAW